MNFVAPMNIDSYLRQRKDLVDHALDAWLPSEDTLPSLIHRAMRYSIFAGGKRIRPILCLAAAEACGGDAEVAMPAACAVETLHTYTLIHDDLPCMDDDDLRRGRPTNHKMFGEGVAVLAGDALLTESFAILARTPENSLYGMGDYVRELTDAAGSRRLIGGQTLDLEGEGRTLSLDEIKTIHNGKTAALLTASLRLGGMSAACSSSQLESLTEFGLKAGLAFQIIDDILDVISTPEQMGKSIGKDARDAKATYPALVGLDNAKNEARRLAEEARAALEIFPVGRRDDLVALNDYLLNRNF